MNSDEDTSSLGSSRTGSAISLIRKIDDAEDTNISDSPDRSRMVLIETYGCGVKKSFNPSTMNSINKAIRKLAIPKIKFLPTTKSFGGFEQPDFADPNCWVNKIFEFINMSNASDKKKAQIWMTYRHKVKDQFSLHRSAVTSKIKVEFMKGKKCVCHCNFKHTTCTKKHLQY